MESVNRMAIELVDEALEFAEELGVGAHELDNGATVLDFGVEFGGGIEAGLLLAEIQTGGLATVQSTVGDVGGTPVPYVELTTDHPDVALLCSQMAGWEVSVDGYEALGSGPARALVAEEEPFSRIGYVDAFDLTVLALEGDQLPDESVAEHVAETAEVEPSSVFLPTFPSASLVGSVTLAARASELAVYRLSDLGYDPTKIVSASGSAPVAPVAGDEETAIALTNDALAYGGRVHLVVEEDFERFGEVPSTATDSFGESFASVIEGDDVDFSELDEGAFAPGSVTVDVVGGPTYALGSNAGTVLAESFGVA